MKSLGSKLHATTWWAIAVFASAVATISTSPVFLSMICLLSLLAMKLFRDSTLRSRSIAFYLVLAAAIITIRFVFRIVFNQPDLFQATALDLPVVKVGTLISLFGPVSFLSLQSALTDGLRLAAIILAIGMANTVANPRKLLRSTPGALYEIATAAAVAINLAPQLIESMHRVRRARSLRSQTKGFRAFKTIVIPVLEDALDRSLSLAASMDARGFGRQESANAKKTATSRTLLIFALLLVTIGSFGYLTTVWSLLSVVAIVCGLLMLVLALRVQSARQLRSFYRPEKPRALDYAVGFATCAGLLGMSFL